MGFIRSFFKEKTNNRFQNREYRRFLFIALGSCAELETQIDISLDLDYLNQDTKENLIGKINYEARMINSLIKKLEYKPQTTN